jgi:hypothetical protein
MGDIEETMSEALDPPLTRNIRRAIDALIDVALAHPTGSWGKESWLTTRTGQSTHNGRGVDATRSATRETPTRRTLRKTHITRRHLPVSRSDSYSSCHSLLKVTILYADGRKTAG